MSEQDDDQVREAANLITFLRKVADTDLAADMLSAWAAKRPDLFARVCLELANPFGPYGEVSEDVLKEAHAAYNRKERTPVVEGLEREYRRRQKAKNRSYVEFQKRRQAGAA